MLWIVSLTVAQNYKPLQNFNRAGNYRDHGAEIKGDLRYKIRQGVQDAIEKEFGTLFSKPTPQECEPSSSNNIGNELTDLQKNAIN